MTAALKSDGGFSLVEVLVGLAIASVVVMGIGGLMSLAISVRASADEGNRVQRALVDLQAILHLAREATDLNIAHVADFEFSLQPVGTVSDEAPAIVQTLSLSEGSGKTMLELVRGDRHSAADLSAFEAAGLEYLTVDPDMKWQVADRIGAGHVIGARLRLQLRERVWRPLIWMVSPFETQLAVSRRSS
jgi:prepilin-type N-terminal cleavage/methylation domain-containing protein